MRKHQLLQITELLRTIEEAQSQELYADCQDAAVAIGEFIEEIEGEGTQTVALLEEYCDLLFAAANGELGERALRKQLTKIGNSVKSELKPDRVEMAFLSYNASMSDAIESIYLEAKAHPDCDAYWIPIPYYERLSDGSLGPMRFDGPECYGHLECTDWREYNIEARRPDAVFTFAPYDTSNFVTCVHPLFHCERLRDLTDMLVYVPYYVMPAAAPEHFCTVPGCIYAHKVIVQIEKGRLAHASIYKEMCGDRFGRAEDKFVTLGSPKFDKVLNTKRGDCTLPDNWFRIIAGKKVVFYNTSVSSILQGGEAYLQKLGLVFNEFRKRDGVTLWWRPHPLSRATYASMRPGLLAEYDRIVEEYRRESFGIYDDTANLHRAIACSDAYYGDISSVAFLYAVTGKPVMYQDPGLLPGNDNRRAPAFTEFYDDGEYFWFSAQKYNALFRMDMRTWKPEYVTSFPGERFGAAGLYAWTARYGDRLYFAPKTANEISVYDTVKNELRKIPIAADLGNFALKYCGAVNYGKYVYFTPLGDNPILRLDTETQEITAYSDWRGPLKALTAHNENNYSFRAFCVNREKIIMPSPNAPAIVVFDMETCVSEVIKVGARNSGYYGVCFDGRNYWLAPWYTDSVVKWNPVTRKFKEYDAPGGGFSKYSRAYGSAVYAGGYAYFFPRCASNAVKINIETEELSIAEAFQPECGKPLSALNSDANINYICAKAIGGTIYALTGKSNTFISYNTETNERREELIIPENAQSETLKTMGKHCFAGDGQYADSVYDCIFHESFAIDIVGYLDYIVNDYDSDLSAAVRKRTAELCKKEVNADGASGRAIYELVRGVILNSD